MTYANLLAFAYASMIADEELSLTQAVRVLGKAVAAGIVFG